MLRFNDGIDIDTDGALRILRLHDGYYVVGEGMCIPVEAVAEGIALIRELKSLKENREE